VIRRWTLDGDPHGLAIGSDGTIYVGLAQPQAVVAIDPKSGAVKRRVVLDSAEIASTKELVTLRLNREHTRLYVANGSDESATILALPDLHVVREITMEGEPIRDALPDPKGRYLYVLGRRVHVYDAKGETELHTLTVDDPSAIATNGSLLAVAGGDAIVTFDTATFAEKGRTALPSKPVTALAFSPKGAVLALSAGAIMSAGESQAICLPDGSGPQIVSATANLVIFGEKRCTSSSAVSGAASIYGVNMYALAIDGPANTLAATDRAGYLTIYRIPRSPVVH
jgi:WD40 repeat protein